MASFPGAIFAPRTKANRAGVSYDATKTTVLFAEDVVKDDQEIVAIETELGLNPKGAHDSVADRFNDVESDVAGKQAALGFTAENVANKDTTTTLGTSDTKYPSQKAVKTYVDTGLGTKQNSLGFTAEDSANKSTSTSLGTSDTLYPSQKAVKTYVDAVKKGFSAIVVAPTTDLTVADGQLYIPVPACMNGMNLVRAQAIVNTAGTTNATTIDVYNMRAAHDMLSTAISIASGGTVGTVGTINTTYDDVATDDLLRIDVTTASTTKPKGLVVVLEFQNP